eukprot:TRINITY_DN16269_c2_g1_i1.p1 TRINITY_DN16269_c2_g1~~TRINITY_DN16269_c2_g1_i1.p1  ORF type:complete len:107 (+),score=11.02 TRINITY_DN16269_c2_g1_i1:767-1087(+)
MGHWDFLIVSLVGFPQLIASSSWLNDGAKLALATFIRLLSLFPLKVISNYFAINPLDFVNSLVSPAWKTMSFFERQLERERDEVIMRPSWDHQDPCAPPGYMPHYR